MKKIIKVLTSLVITLLLSVAITAPKTAAMITVDDLEELRGVWVSTVSNIDISRQNDTTDKSINAYKDKLLSILDRVENLGLNAIFFQVRPANDALYDSSLNPYSKYLVGYGVNPGWDMLSWFIEKCHERGIELHAWLNPYRVTGETAITSDMTQEEIKQAKFNLRNELLKVDPDCNNPLAIENDEEFLSTIVAGAEGKFILNPAKEASINHIVNSIEEIIEKYDVDGIHFDDYFYPSGGIEVKYDTEDYNAYKAVGGNLSVEDWRRDNVNKMIERVHNTVEAHNATNSRKVAFGVSPAAVWAPSSTNCPDRGAPGGVEGIVCGSYSTYTQLYADTKKWVEEEWLDYILPQVYYEYGDDYQKIVKWWANLVSKVDVKLYIGTAIYRVSEWGNGGEIKQQFDFLQSNYLTKANVSGFVLFSYRNLISPDDHMKLATNNIMIYCQRGALHPVYNHSDLKITEDALIKIYRTTNQYTVQFTEVENANGYVLCGLPKGTTVDFTSSSTAIKNAYNQATGSFLRTEIVSATSVENFDYYLRVFDANNIEHKYYKLDFDHAIMNEGAKITSLEFNEKNYAVNEEIIIKFKAESEMGLPLTATMEVSVDGGEYRNKMDIKCDDNGIYTFKYNPFKDGTLSFRLTVNDTDLDKTLEMGPVVIGNGLDGGSENPGPDNPNPDNPDGSKSDCNFGTFVVLPIIALASLLLLRKREF